MEILDRTTETMHVIERNIGGEWKTWCAVPGGTKKEPVDPLAFFQHFIETTVETAEHRLVKRETFVHRTREVLATQ